MKNIRRILIANRGEIAHRIATTIEKMGLTPITVYSDADRETLAVERAKEKIRLGPAPVGESYLDMNAVLRVAREAKADAIHPGYGLLSENSEFARKVIESGLVWIGPSPESMDRVASKSKAKELAESVEVPTIPGHRGSQDIAEFGEAARKIGYPVMLKAAAGGGGRGIRKVADETELPSQWNLAKSEASSAFGDSELLLEKYVRDGHHVEVQVFGDSQGHVVHLGERDCSVQRRNQKMIEEAPSPAIDPKMRAQLLAAAVRLAGAAKYENAGTVEFMVTPEGAFYFLEMNTRLQVEHPVTEMITGLDLVEWQIRVARGEALPLTQEQIRFSGHAIQTRLYAEDPFHGYRPQTGRIEAFDFPEGVRVDHFLTQRTVVTPFYDSMLAKLVTFAPNRETARVDAVRALDETLIAGLETNRLFLKEILARDFFKSGETFTRTLDSMKWEAPAMNRDIADEACAIAALAQSLRLRPLIHSRLPLGWCSTSDRETLMPLRLGNRVLKTVVQVKADHVQVNLENRSYSFRSVDLSQKKLKFSLEESSFAIPLYLTPDSVDLNWRGFSFKIINELSARAKSLEVSASDEIRAPMAGVAVQVRAKAGDPVHPGQVVVVIEAMKMQIEVRASIEGRIATVLVTPGQQVRAKQPLFKMET